MSAAEYDLAILATNVNRNEGYAVTACGALLTYDILTSLDKEVQYVWMTPWSFGTVLYLLNRYLPYVDAFMAVTLFSTTNSPEKCQIGNIVLTWFVVAGSLISEGVLMVRTYAIWGRKRNILFGLIGLWVATMVTVTVITYLEVSSWEYGPSPFPNQSGCFPVHVSKIIFVAYIMLIFCETCIVILTMIKGAQHLRQTRSAWILKMYQDGLLFYFYTLMTSVVNIIVPLTAPPGYENLFGIPQRLLHSLFCARVLLLLFEQRYGSIIFVGTNYELPPPAESSPPVIRLLRLDKN
ncbi:hypothetical protein FIBSPDRAFT_1051127 [Athelia psychrophila]|uniref:DUF6533 domain-containing protein n=1 Tax=Athelia psychrophila TaxID=1759441 RepID=A0A165ZMJ1_9AGAM|nr:hypothetical protein FIBSPDRAFT_1051127 [Fibularhizoctonia sp. CBS 109695]